MIKHIPLLRQHRPLNECIDQTVHQSAHDNRQLWDITVRSFNPDNGTKRHKNWIGKMISEHLKVIIVNYRKQLICCLLVLKSHFSASFIDLFEQDISHWHIIRGSPQVRDANHTLHKTQFIWKIRLQQRKSWIALIIFFFTWSASLIDFCKDLLIVR